MSVSPRKRALLAISLLLALVVVSLIGSLGMHLWMPLNNSLGLGLAQKENSGKVALR